MKNTRENFLRTKRISRIGVELIRRRAESSVIRQQEGCWNVYDVTSTQLGIAMT